MEAAALSEPSARPASFLVRLDPRVKLGGTLVYAGLVAVLTSLWAAGAALGFSAALWGLVAPRRAQPWIRLAVANGLLAFLWLVLPWSVPGEVLGRVGPLELSRAGLRLCLLLTLKSNAILLVTLALAETSGLPALLQALAGLRLPRRLLTVGFFCLRYLEVIRGEYQRLVSAMKVRGFRPRTNWQTYRAYAYLVGMLLVRSHDRAVRIYEAMLCRGFRGHFPVSERFRFSRDEGYALALLVTFCLFLGWLQWS